MNSSNILIHHQYKLLNEQWQSHYFLVEEIIYFKIPNLAYCIPNVNTTYHNIVFLLIGMISIYLDESVDFKFGPNLVGPCSHINMTCHVNNTSEEIVLKDCELEVIYHN